MEAIVECCAGLDVHQASVVVCLNKGPATKRSGKEVRSFGTTRAALEAMRAWLEHFHADWKSRSDVSTMKLLAKFELRCFQSG